MPQSTRHWIRRKLDQASDNIKQAEIYLSEVGEKYESQHKDYFDHVCMLLAAADQIQKGIIDFRDKT